MWHWRLTLKRTTFGWNLSAGPWWVYLTPQNGCVRFSWRDPVSPSWTIELVHWNLIGMGPSYMLFGEIKWVVRTSQPLCFRSLTLLGAIKPHGQQRWVWKWWSVSPA